MLSMAECSSLSAAAEFEATRLEIMNNFDEISKFMVQLREWENELQENEFMILPVLQAKESKNKKKKKKKKGGAASASADLENLLVKRKPQPIVSLKKMELAKSEKEKGNKLLKKHKWTEAIGCYDTAVQHDPTSYVCFVNRGYCYLQEKDLPRALEDCQKCLEIEPTFGKGYLRRGQVYVELGNYSQAEADFKCVLLLEAKNQEAKEELEKLYELLKTKSQEIKEDVNGTQEDDPVIENVPAAPAVEVIRPNDSAEVTDIVESMQKVTVADDIQSEIKKSKKKKKKKMPAVP